MLRATRVRSVQIVLTTVSAFAVLLPFLVLGHTAGFEIVHPMTVVVLGGLELAGREQRQHVQVEVARVEASFHRTRVATVGGPFVSVTSFGL